MIMIMVFVRKCHPAASRAAHSFKEIPGHVEVSIDDNDCVDVDEKKKIMMMMTKTRPSKIEIYHC